MSTTIRPNALFLPVLALSLIARCIEANISVPGFPAMVEYFGVSEGTIQLTIAYDCLGCCLACPFYGPLADAYGRRPVMIWGNIILMLGAVGCVVAPTISLLLFSRFIQGIGTATSLSVVFAMIADVYKGEKGVRAIGMMNSILTGCMAISPVAGAFIFQFIGWRGTYGTVALVCIASVIMLVLYLPETRPSNEPLRLRTVARNYGQLLQDMPFMSASTIPSILYAGVFSFVACAPFLYMSTLKLPLVTYACNQGLVVAAYAVTNFFAGRLDKLWGARKTVLWGYSALSVGTAAFFLSSLWGIASAYWVTIPMMVYSVGCGLVYPVIFTASMEMFPHIKGTSASAIMSMRSIILAIWIAVTSVVYDGTLLSVALLVLSSLIGAIVCGMVVVPRLGAASQKS